MKTILLFLSFLMLSVGSQAQLIHKFSGKQYPYSQTRLNKTGVKNLPQLTLFYSWNSQNHWQVEDSLTSVYNTKGFVQSAHSIRRNGEQTQTTYVYNTAGKQTASYELKLNSTTQSWDSSSKSIKTYDGIGTETERIKYSFDVNTGWHISEGYKFIYTYNTAQRPTIIESLYYQDPTNGYVEDTRQLLEYDNSGVLVSVIEMQWDEDADEYKNRSKTTNIIWHRWIDTDIDASLISSADEFEWNGSTFVLSSRNSITYDSHNNEIESSYEGFDGSNWFIDDAYKFLLTYNSDGILTDHIEQYWKNADSSWVNNLRFGYSDFVAATGLKNVAQQQIGLFISPNPFSENAEITLITTLESPQFSLYDATGKNIRNIGLTSQSSTLKRDDLAPGIYFYIVTDKSETVAHGKLIIE